MQFLYAAPFIAVALIAFTTCILIPKGRKYAFAVSGAVFAFAPGGPVGFLLMILITDWVTHAKQPATFWFVLSFIAGGLFSAAITVIAIRLILSRVREEVLRWVVAFGCLGHLIVLTVVALSGSLYLVHSSLSGGSLTILFATVPLLISLYPTILLTRRSEQFRPSLVLFRKLDTATLPSE